MAAYNKVSHSVLEEELKSRLRYIGVENIMMTFAEH